MMTFYKRLLLIGIILFSCVGCDQVTKVVDQKYLTPSHPISYLGDTIRLQYIENNGAFLSLGAKLPANFRFWSLIVSTGIAVVGMLVFILVKRSLRPSFVIAISFIIGGGVSNLIDRMFNNGAVIDFINIGIGRLCTGIFNVADVAIMTGMGLLVFFGLRYSRLGNNF